MNYESFIQSIEISSNDIANGAFTDITANIYIVSMILVLTLLFVNLSISLLKNI